MTDVKQSTQRQTTSKDQQQQDAKKFTIKADKDIVETLKTINKVVPKKKSSFAYVTLVMLNEEYALGAVVLAHSLRMTNPDADLICFVDDSVKPKTLQLLTMYFDYVPKVSLIRRPTKRPLSKRAQELYLWIDASYTKWWLLALDKYERVCFLDADLVVTNNMDHLFRSLPELILQAMDNPWVDSANKKNRDPYYQGKKDKRYKSYYLDVDEGNIVDPELLRKGLRDGYVGSAHIVVLKPHLYDFLNLVEHLTKALPGSYPTRHVNGEYGSLTCSSGADEQVLADYFTTANTVLGMTELGFDLSIRYQCPVPMYRSFMKLSHGYGLVLWQMSDLRVFEPIPQTIVIDDDISSEEAKQLDAPDKTTPPDQTSPSDQATTSPPDQTSPSDQTASPSGQTTTSPSADQTSSSSASSLSDSTDKDFVKVVEKKKKPKSKPKERFITRPYMIHYAVGAKPWKIERSQYNDHDIWWNYAQRVVKYGPLDGELKEHFITGLSGVNTLFKSNLEVKNLDFCAFCEVLKTQMGDRIPIDYQNHIFMTAAKITCKQIAQPYDVHMMQLVKFKDQSPRRQLE